MRRGEKRREEREKGERGKGEGQGEGERKSRRDGERKTRQENREDREEKMLYECRNMRISVTVKYGDILHRIMRIFDVPRHSAKEHKNKQFTHLASRDVGNAHTVVAAPAHNVNGVELHALHLPRVHLALAQNLACFEPPDENAAFHVPCESGKYVRSV